MTTRPTLDRAFQAFNIVFHFFLDLGVWHLMQWISNPLERASDKGTYSVVKFKLWTQENFV